MKTTIFVPTITSDAQWIFCNQKEAFNLGLLNAAKKILTGYHTALDASAAYLEKQPQEPFAVIHLSFDDKMRSTLIAHGYLQDVTHPGGGRNLWRLSREGANLLFDSKGFTLLMEIVPVVRTGVCLY